MPPLKKLHAQELLPNVKVAIVAALGEGLFIHVYTCIYIYLIFLLSVLYICMCVRTFVTLYLVEDTYSSSMH